MDGSEKSFPGEIFHKSLRQKITNDQFWKNSKKHEHNRRGERIQKRLVKNNFAKIIGTVENHRWICGKGIPWMKRYKNNINKRQYAKEK